MHVGLPLAQKPHHQNLPEPHPNYFIEGGGGQKEEDKHSVISHLLL